MGAAMNKVYYESDIPDITKALNSFSDGEVEVGFFGQTEKEEGSNITVLDLAKILHEGCEIKVTNKMRGYLSHLGLHLKASTEKIKIPARPWLDTSIPRADAFSKVFFNAAFDQIVNAPKSVSGRQQWERLGSALVGIMKKEMVDLRQPANHPITIKLKGSDNPLVDTGHLVNSIMHEYRRR